MDLGALYPDLINLSAQCKRAADFKDVLKRICGFAQADGCVIWEKFYAGNDDRRYFMLAHHFPFQDGEPVWHYLPRKCETGEAIETQTPRFVPDVEEAARQGRVPGGNLLKSRGITAFYSIPITFGDRREAAAANFYWKDPKVPNAVLRSAIAAAASVLPTLLHSVLNRVGFELLQEVERRLNASAAADPDTMLSNVGGAVADAFNASECCIFLEDKNQNPGIYKLRASRWPWTTFSPVADYVRGSEGLTPWVIRHKQSLRFVDLEHFEDERSAEASSGKATAVNYKDLTWPTKGRLVAEAAERYGVYTRPLSFLCVPIQAGDAAVGAIRCCLTETAPYLFDDRHKQILELVAEQIGHWWGTIIALQAERAETTRYRTVVEGIGSMHETAFKSLKDLEKPSMKALWDRSLELIAKVCPWPDALSIRMVDGDVLRYVAHRGSRWGKEGNILKAKLSTTYPLNEPWAGSRVIKQKTVVSNTNPGRLGQISSHLFPDATRLVHLPILAGNAALGVIDIRGFDQREVPPHLTLTCELIGWQLGLYHNLQELFWKLRSREKELSKQRDEHPFFISRCSARRLRPPCNGAVCSNQHQ